LSKKASKLLAQRSLQLPYRWRRFTIDVNQFVYIQSRACFVFVFLLAQIINLR